MKQDYTQLDAAILAAIKDGFNSTGNILHSSSAGNMCCDMAEKCASGKVAYRFLEARLQALRKRRQIEFCRFTRAWGLSPA